MIDALLALDRELDRDVVVGLDLVDVYAMGCGASLGQLLTARCSSRTNTMRRATELSRDFASSAVTVDERREPVLLPLSVNYVGHGRMRGLPVLHSLTVKGVSTIILY